MVVGIHRRHDADADARAFGEFCGGDGKLFIAAIEFFFEAVAAHRAEVAFDVHPQHLLEFFAQVARDEMQRLFEHRATFDGVNRHRRLQAAVQFFRERAFARPNRAHEVEHLAALFAL